MLMLDPNQENVMREAFLMKAQMITWISFAALGFCVTKFLDFALANMLDDSYAKARCRIVLQSFDFVWITSIMVVCRARKEWPPYFTLSINEIPGLGEGEDGSRVAALAPSMVSIITEKFLFDEDADDARSSCGSIGSDEAVLFVNPCNYTLEDDDYDADTKMANGGREVSAFDPDSILEENGAGLDKGEGDAIGNRDEI